MKKLLILFVLVFGLASCSEDDEVNFQYALLPVEEAIVPESFSRNQVNLVTVNYSLPNGCFTYPTLYYQYEGSTRIVAVRAAELLDNNCTQAIVPLSMTFRVVVTQEEDYVFRFWKGLDDNGDDVFEEIVVPVY